MPPPPPPPPLFPYTTLFRSGAAQPVSLPLAEFRPERLSRPPEPVLRAHAPDRPRADGTVSRLLLRTRGRSGLGRRAAGVRQPGRHGGQEPRGGGAARRTLGNPERRTPPLGERAVGCSFPASLRGSPYRL